MSNFVSKVSCASLFANFVLTRLVGIDKQWLVLDRHFSKLRSVHGCEIHVVIVENNLGFESQHHREHLSRMMTKRHWCMINDPGEIGVRTTAATKQAMWEITRRMLNDGSLNASQTIVNGNAATNVEDTLDLLKRQLRDYSMVSDPHLSNVMSRPARKYAHRFSGKFRGREDDLAIALQMGALFRSRLWTQPDLSFYAAVANGPN